MKDAPPRKAEPESGRAEERIRQRKTFILRVALTISALLLIELGLQVAARLNSQMALVLLYGLNDTRPDDLIRWRLNPAIPDHDEAGWRNPEVLAQADIVALGDSQTYGDEVAQQNAWPLLLGNARVTSYNMGVSGFGPIDYYLLGPEALEKCPAVILVGIYSGNDMVNAYREGVMHSRAPELVDLETLARDELLAIDVERGEIEHPFGTARAARRGRWKTMRDAYFAPFYEQCMLWGAVRAIGRIGNQLAPNARGDKVRQDFDEYAQTIAVLPREDFFAVRGPNAATVLIPRGRSAMMSLDDPRVAAGTRITVQALARLRDLCGTECTVVVVLIPTKELVFEDEVVASGVEPPASYRALLRHEKELWQFFRASLDEEGIAYVEVLDSLKASVAAGNKPFHADWDGHSNVAGNQAIAAQVAKHPALRALESD